MRYHQAEILMPSMSATKEYQMSSCFGIESIIFGKNVKIKVGKIKIPNK
jgi:hypothetical protein